MVYLRDADESSHDSHRLRQADIRGLIRPTPGCSTNRTGSPWGINHRPHGVGRYFFESTAARNRSSDSTSAGSATVSAISWRKSSRYLLRSL